MREICHWLSMADMSPQSYCDDVEDGCIKNRKYVKTYSVSLDHIYY